MSVLLGGRESLRVCRQSCDGHADLELSQHLACVKWLAHACNATVEGAEKGSKTLLFQPGDIGGGLSPAYTKKKLDSGEQVFEARLDIGTAGATGLALQAILPFILFSSFSADASIPIRLTLSGGTNVSGSPSYEYISQVLLPTLRNIGFDHLTTALNKRGWSHGGSSIGNLTLDIAPRRTRVLPAFQYGPSHTNVTEPRKPSHIKATFIAPASCHDHFRTVLLPALRYQFDDEGYTEQNSTLSIDCEDSKHEKRMYLILVATIPMSSNTPASASSYILARDWLYDRKLRSHERCSTEMAERVAKELADEWLSGAFVDEHMRDQLVIFQALAEGRSEVYAGRDLDDEEQPREPSLHARTAEWVANRMLGVKYDDRGGCLGVGFGGEDPRSGDGRDEKKVFDEVSEGIGRLRTG